MSVIVDTSVWIDYFRGGKESDPLDFLIDQNRLVTNDLILTELIPFLKIQNKKKLINLLYHIKKLDLSINWNQIAGYQYECLKNGLNEIGIPDLLILQNARQNRCEIYTLDHHFFRMKEILDLDLFTKS